MNAPHQRFAFDTVFDGGQSAAVPLRAKRFYDAAEVEQIRAESFAAGERQARESAEGLTAVALADIAQAVAHALPTLAACAHAHREGAAELALVAAQAIAGAALERFPEAPVRAAMEALAREIEAAPRLVVTVSEGGFDRAKAALDQAVDACGFAGQVSVKRSPEAAPAAFTFDWGEGRAAFDPQASAVRIGEALREALAAEGLHAEPLPPSPAPLAPTFPASEADHD